MRIELSHIAASVLASAWVQGPTSQTLEKNQLPE